MTSFSANGFLQRESFESGGLATGPGIRWVTIALAPDEAVLALIECPRQGECTESAADRMVDEFLKSTIARGIRGPEALHPMNDRALGEGIRVAATIVWCRGLRLTVTSAGARGPLIVDSRARQMQVEGDLLGYSERPRFGCSEHVLSPWECAVLTSRGVNEALNAADDFFSPSTALPRVLDRNLSLASNALRCMEAVKRHCGDRGHDDIAIGLIRGRCVPFSGGIGAPDPARQRVASPQPVGPRLR